MVAPRPVHPAHDPATGRVLLLHDDAALEGVLAAGLPAAGYTLVPATSPDALLAAVGAGAADLVVLEPALVPDPPALCTALRVAGGCRLLLATRRPELDAELRAIVAGADTYLRRYPPAAVLAYARALLRRAPYAARPEELRPVTAVWRLDVAGRRLVGACSPRPLSPTACRLLVQSLNQPDRVQGRQALLLAVWGPAVTRLGYAGADTELSQYVRELRCKLEPEPDCPRYLLTVRGVGYQNRGPEPPQTGAPGGEHAACQPRTPAAEAAQT